MEFKEWLTLDEVRFKGLKRMFRSQHPDMPKYVQDDLYNSRIGYAMSRQVGSGSAPPTTPQYGSDMPSQIMNRAGLHQDKWKQQAELLKGRNGQEGVTPAGTGEYVPSSSHAA